MFIQVFSSGPLSTNAYVVACAATREAAIVDPAPDSSLDIENYIALQHLKPKMILLTHSHWDHIADAGKLKGRYAIPVYVHPLDVPNLQQPGADGLPSWLDIAAVVPDFLLDEGAQVPLGKLLFRVIHTPGHSVGSVCFYEQQHGLLFSGDTLFKGTYGNISFPTSKPALMGSSLKKLAELPSETRVFPGHGPETTVANEGPWIQNF